MTAQVLPVPFASGIDQSLSTAVGEPRITRLHNARLDAPGRVKVSPGYFRASSPTNMRAAVQLDDKVCVIRSSGGLLSTGNFSLSETRVYSDEDEATKWAQPAFEAPTRVNFPAATATWAAPTAANDPDRWMLLSVQTNSVGEAATLYLLKGTTIVQQVALSTSYSSVRYRLVTNYSTGVGSLIKVDSSAHTVSVYSVSIGDTQLAGSTVTVAGLTSKMVDATMGDSAPLLSVLMDDGTVKLLTNSPSWVYTGSISVGATACAITCTGTELLVLRSTGEAQTYELGSLSAKSSATAIATPATVIALSKRIVGGKYYVSTDTTNADTSDVDSCCYSINTGTTSGPLTVAEVSYQTLSALPAGAPFVDASGNVYQTTINRAAVSRSLQVSRVYTDTPLRVRRVLTAAHGEMPLFSTAAQQGGLTSGLPAATAQLITIADSLCGVARPAWVIPSVYVTSGTLTETTAKTAGMALVFCADATSMGNSTTCMTGFDAMSVTRTAYGRVLSAGAPFAVGARGLCTGAAIDLPVPYVTQAEAASGTNRFSAGQVFQYIVQYEYRAPDGTLFRGPPSQPVTHTVVAPTSPSTVITGLVVTLGITQESPEMPGLRVRLYRTENGGSVFYDTAATDSATGVGVHALTDHTSDATLIGQQLLTDGPAVLNGIKARYGFPPHRCSWRGRDRAIVGGLENPRRVRWSMLDFPGEATAFAHASELGWSADVPDDVTAVAQLDDAWIVFSRTRIWAIYGAGPDDNGMSGAFDPPRLISPNIGCVTWKSLAEDEAGLYFQAADGQIYLLTRGQNAVQWFSARVRDELSAGMLGTALRNPVVATIPHDSAQTVHFVRAPLPGGASPILVYDSRTDAWSTDGDDAVEGLNGAIGGASVQDYSSAAKAGQQTVCTLTPTYLTLENATGTAIAPIGSTWTALVETNETAPFGLAGWGHVYRIGLIVDTTVTPVSFTITEWLNRWRGNAHGSATLTYTADELPFLADFPFLSWTPAKDKASAVRVRLTWTDKQSAVVGLVLSLEQSQGAQRLQTARKA